MRNISNKIKLKIMTLFSICLNTLIKMSKKIMAKTNILYYVMNSIFDIDLDFFYSF